MATGESEAERRVSFSLCGAAWLVGRLTSYALPEPTGSIRDFPGLIDGPLPTLTAPQLDAGAFYCANINAMIRSAAAAPLAPSMAPEV